MNIVKWSRIGFLKSFKLPYSTFSNQEISKAKEVPNNWLKVLEKAQKVIDKYNSSLPGEKSSLSMEQSLDIGKISDNMKNLIQSKTPLMNLATSYYFNQPGKHFRPLIVLLMSLATNSCENSNIIKESLINQSNSNKIDLEFKTYPYKDFNLDSNLKILPSQRRLAEITELIHTASLLHDDVLDNGIIRRGQPSANVQFDNKVSILAGDFLLGRASMALARLRHVEVFELLASVLSDLVEGEMMQLSNNSKESIKSNTQGLIDFDYYLNKTYMKTASLMAKSCKAVCILGGNNQEISDIGYEYGKNLGLSFQIIDDVLDFISTDEETGKAINVDLDLGLATAPVLFAAQEYPKELLPLISRRFSQPQDSKIAFEYVMKSTGIEKSKQLASKYSQLAAKSIRKLPDSIAKDYLIDITNSVLTRRK